MLLNMLAQTQRCSIHAAIFCMVLMSAALELSAGTSEAIWRMEKEKQALLKFKQGLVDNSNILSSWESEKDCCEWRGVACNNRTGHVIKLDLHGSSGPSAQPLGGNCKQLMLLNLGDNRIQGKLPEWLAESREYLSLLRLRSNKFHGSIPTSWCTLQVLRVLDLSLNNISGVLPQCLGNMTAMKSHDIPNGMLGSLNVTWKGVEMEFGENIEQMRSVDVSSNRLSGTIPESITSLLELMSLNLSRNNLTGTIPADLGRMNHLESLDFSRNRLSGTIPSSFSSLNFLGKLDLSYNNLTGRIPLGTQLQSFDASAYMENLQLCGPPLTKYCPGDDETDEKPHGPENDENQDKELVNFGFYVSIGVGFIVGFWGVCGSLLFHTSWRYAYFRFWNNINDRIYVTARVFKARLQRKFAH